MQEERRGSALERTANKREQNDLMKSGVLNRFKYNGHQNDEQQRTYAAIATLY